MKKMLMLLLCGLLLCASGCASAAPDEASSTDLPILEVAPEDLDAKLAELSGDAALIGYPIRPGSLADLNGDGVYELYANLCFGSGIVDERVQGYDPAADQVLALSDPGNTAYIVTEYAGGLYIIVRPYDGSDATVYRAVLTNGTLACGNIDAALQMEVLAQEH